MEQWLRVDRSKWESGRGSRPTACGTCFRLVGDFRGAHRWDSEPWWSVGHWWGWMRAQPPLSLRLCLNLLTDHVNWLTYPVVQRHRPRCYSSGAVRHKTDESLIYIINCVTTNSYEYLKSRKEVDQKRSGWRIGGPLDRIVGCHTM